jgi:putative flippase GtrA
VVRSSEGVRRCSVACFAMAGVGFVISLIYSVVVIAAVRLLRPIGPVTASILAFGIVLPISWLAHGKISFGDRPRDVFQPLRFAMSTMATFVVAVGGMYWITEIAGHSYLFGIAWNWLVVPATNFLSCMFWVFRSRRNGRQMA